MGKGFIQRLHPRDLQMATEHLKKCPTSHVIREIQAKTLRYYYVSVRMDKIQNMTTPNADKDVEHWKL